MPDYRFDYSRMPPEWHERERKRRRSEAIQIGAVLSAVLLLMGGFFFIIWAAEPAVYKPYRCEDRGGIKQAIFTKGGYTTGYICEDGTQQPSEIKVRGAHWKWNK